MPHFTDILLIGNDIDLQLALEDGGFRVDSIGADDDLYAAVSRLQPRAVLIRSDNPGRDALEHLSSLCRSYPQPTLLLHDGRDAELTREALNLGISAYVVEGLSAGSVRALIEVSISHQQQLLALKKELSRSQKTLAERKLIDAAKCLLMERLGITESRAFGQLKQQAMDNRISISEAARQLLANKDTA